MPGIPPGLAAESMDLEDSTPSDAVSGSLCDMWSQLVGVLLGGALAALGSLVVMLTTERRSRSEWRRQAQLESAQDAVRALHKLNREITNLAISDLLSIDGSDGRWDRLHAATIEWNTARTMGKLIMPQVELDILDRLDREFDRLLETAMSAEWDPTEFRRERVRLGELAAEFAGTARCTALEGSVRHRSVWSWGADSDGNAFRPPTGSADRG